MNTQTEVRLTPTERISIAIGRMGGRGKVADYFGVNPSTVTRWTGGETVPTAMTLRAISLASDIPYEWLRPGPNDLDPALVVRHQGLEPRTH